MSDPTSKDCRIEYHQGAEEEQEALSEFRCLKDASVVWGVFFLWEDKYWESNGLHLQFVCIMFSASTLMGFTQILGTAWDDRIN